MLRDVLFLANEDFNQIQMRKSKEKKKKNWALEFGVWTGCIAGSWHSKVDDMRKT